METSAYDKLTGLDKDMGRRVAEVEKYICLRVILLKVNNFFNNYVYDVFLFSLLMIAFVVLLQSTLLNIKMSYFLC